MSEYDDVVHEQRLLLEAEQWADQVAGMHAHSLGSMWYDDRPQDTADGKGVIDIQYNCGLIKRTLQDGQIVYFGKRLYGQELVDAYTRAS